MNRRDTVLALLALLGAPLAAEAQQRKVSRIGFLSQASGPDEPIEAFRDELRGLGYTEGRNLLIEYRWAAGNRERLAELATELVRLKVDLIVTRGTRASAEAKRATSTIPIVMAVAAEPVGTGIVASLARPGGNVTGMSVMGADLVGKRLQLLQELLPKTTCVAILAEKHGPSVPFFLEQVRMAAQQMGITLVVPEVSAAETLAEAFAVMQRAGAQGLIVQLSPFTVSHSKRIVELAAQHHLPAIFETRAFVDADGLMSYGPSFAAMHRRAALYVDRILKGAKPADLPVEQPTTFELIINLRTAKAIGLTVPRSVLARADMVIQ